MNDPTLKCEGICYLVMSNPRWRDLKFRLTAKTPSLKRGEKAVKISIQVPQSLFKEPQLAIDVDVPHDRVSAPVIEADVLENISAILEEQLGLSATVSLVEKENDS